MARPIRSLCPVLLALVCSCAHDRLDASYGLTYRAVFAAQVAPHPGRDLSAMRGDDGRRIMQNYAHSLGGEDKPAGASAGAGVGAPTITGTPGGQGQQNPFAIKAR